MLKKQLSDNMKRLGGLVDEALYSKILKTAEVWSILSMIQLFRVGNTVRNICTSAVYTTFNAGRQTLRIFITPRGRDFSRN